MAMAYITVMGKCAEVDVDEYQMRTGEIARKVQLKLAVPSMRDLLLCEMPQNEAPPTQKLEQWELDETWVVVQADTMRQLGYERKQVRAGERAVGALVTFQAVEMREATADERKALTEHRRATKVKQKQRRAERRAADRAKQEAERAAQEQAKAVPAA